MGYIKNLAKYYFIDAMTGMALGLFVTLIAGLIIVQVGHWLDIHSFINIGRLAIMLMGAGIGVGITWYLKAPPLIMFSCLVAGMMGAHSAELVNGSYFIAGGVMSTPGNPVSAYISTVVAFTISRWIIGKTSLDILFVPFSAMLSAYVACYWLCPPVVDVVAVLSQMIHQTTALQPFLMGVIIAIVVGILLTLPTSSAAICIAIGLNGIAGGAAVVGCAAQMIGFAVVSYRDNGWGGFIAQGLGTSMLQIPNVFRKPIVMLPAIIASAIVGPLATTVFQLHCSAAASGMGTAGLVGVFGVLDASQHFLSPAKLWAAIILLMFILPGLIAWLVSEWMRKIGWLQEGDLLLPN